MPFPKILHSLLHPQTEVTTRTDTSGRNPELGGEGQAFSSCNPSAQRGGGLAYDASTVPSEVANPCAMSASGLRYIIVTARRHTRERNDAILNMRGQKLMLVRHML